jgi:hypothetical protein
MVTTMRPRLLEGARDSWRQNGGCHDVGIGGGKQPCLGLPVEGDVDRDGVAFGQVKAGARKAEWPGILRVQPDHQNDAIAVDRGGAAM